MARVTGLGGIFFKARDPKALAAWYAQHLGLKIDQRDDAVVGREQALLAELGADAGH